MIEQNADLEVILLDLNLPDGDGFNLLAQVREHSPRFRSSSLSASTDRDDVFRASYLGAVGFIPKSAQRAVMLTASSLCWPVASTLTRIFRQGSNRRVLNLYRATVRSDARIARRLGLTGRQIEVLALMMQGKSNKAICRGLKLAEPTVKNHVAAIMKALKVKNRTEAVMSVVEHGWELRPIEVNKANGLLRTSARSCFFKNPLNIARSALGRTGLCSRW